MDIAYEVLLEDKISFIRDCKEPIVICGCEYQKIQLYKRLSKEGINIAAFLVEIKEQDMDETCQGIPIITKDFLEHYENVLLVMYEGEEPQYEAMSTLKVVIPTEKSLNCLGKKDKIKYVFSRIKIYRESDKLYHALLKKYKAEYVFVFSGQSGDLFNALSYLKQYMEILKIDEKCVLTVIGTPCYKVAKMYGINNVEKIDVIQTKKLIKLYELCEGKIGIIPLHTSEAHIVNTVFTKMIRRKKLTLGKMYKYQVCNFSSTTKPRLPEYIRGSEYIKELFFEKNLTYGKTVLISPYANSYMDDSVISKLEELSKLLIDKGYTVLTNCGNETEQPLKGTEGIFIPLEYIVDFVEHAGNFIGIRSGLCDIISGANCKKIILYKEDLYGRGDYTEFHSLNGMGLCSDAIEIKYCSQDKEQVIQRIEELFV